MSLNIQKQDCLSPRSRALKLGLISSRFEDTHMDRKTSDDINYIKRKHRSQIKVFEEIFQKNEWGKQKFYKTNATKLLFECPNEIQRVEGNELTVEEFVDRYEKNNQPIVIKGRNGVMVGVTKDWNVDKYWKLQKFYERCKDIEFKAGEDDKGNKLRIKLKYYLEYLMYNKDDSPLYLFESSLESRESTKDIINWYKVPKYFQDDLFSLTGEKHRPPYRWYQNKQSRLLIGPERSGTTVHIDPLHTSAWNTSLVGHKRWVLFKQQVPKFIVKGLEFKQRGQDIEAIDYFTRILPKIIQKQGRTNLGIKQFIQYPGQTVFVPGGWWHAVINLDDTFAVTQNVMTHTNFGLVWSWMRKERPKFSMYFLKQLNKKAVEINERDNWLMGDKKKRESMSRSRSDSSSSSSSSDYSDSGEEIEGQKRKERVSKSRSREKKREKNKNKGKREGSSKKRM